MRQSEPWVETPYFEAWNALVQYEPGQVCSVAGRWLQGDIGGFLDLDETELALVDVRLALANLLADSRWRNHWTQSEFAARIGTSQSRVSRLEEPDVSVSLDLLVKALLRSGVSRAELGRVIAGRRSRRP